ncbi:hypothetical protein MLD38_000601 [Melastoma candidum]|uniref:Uncharacterized protein n=1 Tax=Melastoma candidum TaxID=119954 RepID=A0ACB9SAJ8_9MYRT|nr:hypothetical protein MLD38_000601 [Melastoma candidum]
MFPRGCHSLTLLTLSVMALASSSTLLAKVPPSSQFQFVNEGELGPYVVEYGGSYRVLNVFAAPFQLSFYNTTPDAFTLALRMGLTRSESLFRWVWEANRGNPVRENATLSFGEDGNLVLADHDGRIAWQTGTANKGVVGFQLLPTGNMVLYDSKGKYVWQSFDSPTDTILVGQSLKANGVNRLLSRGSEGNNVNGPYSLVMEPQGLSLYFTGKNALKPLVYYSFSQYISISKGALDHVTFKSQNNDDHSDDLFLDYQVGTGSSPTTGNLILTRPKYNATLSFLRLGIDGNVKIYTYDDLVDYRAWDVTLSLFSKDEFPDWESECQLPEKCGSFGLCDNSQCVGCPLPGGIFGWTRDCAAPKVSSCNPKDFGYYKLVGVDHVSSKYTKGIAAKIGECEARCTKDCKCAGYFYNEGNKRCWIAYDLMTLTKVANSTHLGYIKAPKK